MVIAVAGKGGVGKTTIASAIVYTLVRNGKRPVLAVDADPNATFSCHLGIKCGVTVSDLREKEFKNPPAGMSKVEWMDMKFQETLCETDKGFDLLVMGRPEGAGCYCAVNELLRTFLKNTASRYTNTVIDNEAGLEHISRRTSGAVDMLFIIAEPNKVSLMSAENVKNTAESVKTEIKNKYLIINKYRNEKINGIPGLETAGVVGYDENSCKLLDEGKTFFTAEREPQAVIDMAEILKKSGVL